MPARDRARRNNTVERHEKGEATSTSIFSPVKPVKPLEADR